MVRWLESLTAVFIWLTPLSQFKYDSLYKLSSIPSTAQFLLHSSEVCSRGFFNTTCAGKDGALMAWQVGRGISLHALLKNRMTSASGRNTAVELCQGSFSHILFLAPRENGLGVLTSAYMQVKLSPRSPYWRDYRGRENCRRARTLATLQISAF